MGNLLSFYCQIFCYIKYRWHLRACGPFKTSWVILVLKSLNCITVAKFMAELKHLIWTVLFSRFFCKSLIRKIASRCCMPTDFISWEPRPKMFPDSSLSAANGSWVQCSRATGTTSVWELSRIEGSSGSDPIHVMMIAGLPGTMFTTL